ncbi:MAG TPA: DUF1579 family protein [Planctomycetia bacterium]|nr:DUF1579 family protein [Planctomycetia bacterium]
MMRYWTAFSVLAAAAAASAIGDGQEGPSSKVAELAALDHYAGSWKTTFSGDGGASTTAATTTGKWILGGRFMQQSVRIGGEGGAAATEVMTMMTFDVDRKVYKSWHFISDGGTMPSEGTWDAEKKTMKTTARSDGDGGRIEITADFSEAGKEKWKIDLFDVAGVRKSTIAGTNVKEVK